MVDFDDKIDSTIKPTGEIKPSKLQGQFDKQVDLKAADSQADSDFIGAIQSSKPAIRKDSAVGGKNEAPSDKQIVAPQAFDKRPSTPGDSGLERGGGQKRSQRATPWTIHVDEKISSAKIVNAKQHSESMRVPGVRPVVPNVSPAERSLPKIVTEMKQLPPHTEPHARSKVNGEAAPIGSASPNMPSAESMRGKTVGAVDGAVDGKRMASPTTEVKSDVPFKPAEIRSSPLETYHLGPTAKVNDAQNIRKTIDSGQKTIGPAPGAGSELKSEVARAVSTDAVPRVNDDPSVRNRAASVIPDGIIGANAKSPMNERANTVSEAPAPTHVRNADVSAYDGPNKTGIKAGVIAEPGQKDVPTAPTRTVSLVDAGPGADAKATNHGPNGLPEGGATKVPAGRVDGGKIPPSVNDGGKIPEATSPNDGIRLPPKLPQSDGTRKPLTTAPGEGTKVSTTPIEDSAGPKITGQNNGEKRPADGIKTDGSKSPATSTNVGDKTQGQVPGSSKSPGISVANDGKIRTPEAKANGSTVTGSKTDVGSKTDSANDGKTSKTISPATGARGDARTPVERPDPRAGKERATPQVDPGTHAESGRTVKGQRETEIGTRTPVQRGDREPTDPAGRGDKIGKNEVGVRGDKQATQPLSDGVGKGKSGEGKGADVVGNRGDKQGPSPSAGGAGKGQRGEGKASDDAGKKQNAIGDKEPSGSKASSGIKDGSGSRRTETAGTTDGAGFRSPDAPGVKGNANAKAPESAGIKASEGSRNPETTGVKAGDGSRAPQTGGVKGEGLRNPDLISGKVGDGTRTPESGVKVSDGSRTPQTGVVQAGEGLRNPDMVSGKIGDGTRTPESGGVKVGDGSRTPQSGVVKAGEGLRNPDAISGKVGEGSRTPELGGVKADGSRTPELGGGKADGLRIPESTGAKEDGVRRPQRADGKVGDSATPAPGGIKIGAKDQGTIKPLGANDGAGQRGSGSTTGAPKGPGQKPPFASIVGSDQKTSFGLKDWVAGKKVEGAEKQSKGEPSKIETGKPATPQSKLPAGFLIERGLPSVAKAQPEKTRGITPGVRIDSAQLARSDDSSTKNPLRSAESERIPTAASSKFITMKLDTNRLPQIEATESTVKGSVKGSVEQTIVLSVARRFDGGLLELPVPKKVIETARVAPVLNLEATKINIARRELSSTIRGEQRSAIPKEQRSAMPGEQRSAMPAEPATRTFAKHQPEGQGVKMPQGDAVTPGLRADTAGGGSERVESLLPKTRSDRTLREDVPSEMVPHSIRDVFRKFHLALPKRTFSPEITESGSYVIQRGQSSQRLQAFISSGQHKALRAQSESSLFDTRKFVPSLEDDIDTENEEGESEDERRSQNQKPDDLMFAKAATTAASGHHAQHGSVRKMYIVQAEDTPRSIAVVQLHDHLLEDLIVEINELVFQTAYDSVQRMHVKVLPAGAMILLPNNQDIEEFRLR